jgi:hypothetical protein
MRLRCCVCVCVCVCLCIPPIVARQRLGNNPLIVARQRLGRKVIAVTNTQATTEELLDSCSIEESRRLVLPRTYWFY